MKRPLVIDLYCGLGGWAEGFLAEDYDVIGFDIERHDYSAVCPMCQGTGICNGIPDCLNCNRTGKVGTGPYPGQLVLQDVLTLHGSQFRDAAVIVASPPCQAYSYRAMPWKRAKALPPPDNTLFEACFRIQREAIEATKCLCHHCGTTGKFPNGNKCYCCDGTGARGGRYIPLVVENVCGAQKWVGRAAWHFGSYYLWGDVPALMPFSRGLKNNGGSWFGERDGKPLERNDPRDMRRDETGEFVNAMATGGWNHPGKVNDGSKNDHGSWFAVAHNTKSGKGRNPVNGVKVEGLDWSAYGTPDYKPKGFNVTAAQRFREEQGIKQGGEWWHDPESITRKTSSRSDSRKAASAQIAKIPFPLANHIARVFKP